MFANSLRGEGEITIANKQYPIKLNMNAFRILTQTFGVKLELLEEFMQENQLEAMCALAYCGITAGMVKTGKKFEMDYDVFCAEFLEDETGVTAVADLITGATAGEEEGNTEETGNE